MNNERKPELERLFTAANRKLVDEPFVAGVMARTNKWRAPRPLIGVAICLAAAPTAWLVAAPVNEALQWLTQLIAQPLVGTGDGIASRFALPMNTVGAALVLGLLALRAITHKLFPSLR